MKSNHAFDTQDWRIERDEMLIKWMNGNQEAIEVVQILGEACEVWDDLIDRDTDVLPDVIDSVFTGIFVKLSTNHFWQKGRIFLEPIIIIAINAWMDANKLALSSDTDKKMLAFHIRNYSTEIAMACAFLAGGWEHLRSVSNEMREYFSHETFEEWEFKK